MPAPAEAEKPKARSRRGRGSASTTEGVPIADAKVSPAPVETAPEAEGAPAKPARNRGRRKAAEPVSEAVAQMAAEDEPDTPMEMTVSSEHLTREELVEAEPDQPTTGKGRGRRRSKKLEVEAPTAAASESEAGEVAILVEAELEPGAQLPAELAEPDAEVELTSPAAAPAKRGRSRRTTEAQKAAEANANVDLKNQAEAEVAAEAMPAQVMEAPKRGRSRGKATKPDEQTAAIEAAKGATAAEQAGSAPSAPATPSSAARNPPAGGPASPTTGVEIISTEEKGKVLYHTMRDLRNPSSVVHNVTRKSARRLWLYAITQHEHGDPSAAELAWHPTAQVGLWRREHRAGASRYDLVARYPMARCASSTE